MSRSVRFMGILILVVFLVVSLPVTVFAASGSHKVKFYANDKRISEKKVKKGKIFSIPQKPKKKGYVFRYWTVKRTSDGKWLASNGKWLKSPKSYKKFYSGKKYKLNKKWVNKKSAGFNFYAQWKIKKYTISYDANGGEGNIPSQKKTYRKPVVLSKKKPVLEGYTFKGWATAPEATVPEYKPGMLYRANKSVTLYAVWKWKGNEQVLEDLITPEDPGVEEATYEIIYDANKGTGAPEAQTGVVGTEITIPSTKPTREGYVFVGWGLTSTSSEVLYNPGESISLENNQTVYAIWKENVVSLADCSVYIDGPTSKTYNPNSTFEPKIVVKYGSTVLSNGTDYSISGNVGYNAGNYTAVVEGKGKYAGRRTVSFKVEKAAPSFTFSQTSVTKCENVVRGGFRLGWTAKYDGTKTFKSSNTNIATVTSDGYVTSVNPGTVTISVIISEGKNYKSGKASYSLTLTPATPSVPTPTLSLKNSTMTVTWNKPAYARAYQVQYKSGSGDWKNWSTNTTATKTTLNGLAPATKYSVRVRSINNGLYSSYSAAKSVTTAGNYHLIYYSEYYKNVNAWTSTGYGKETVMCVLDGGKVTIPASPDRWYSLYRSDGKYFAFGPKTGWYTLSEIKKNDYRVKTYYPGTSLTLDSSWTKNCSVEHPYYELREIN